MERTYMRSNFQKLKCNVTITLPVSVVAELDNIVDKENSRNKIVNEAIKKHLNNKYNAKL